MIEDLLIEEKLLSEIKSMKNDIKSLKTVSNHSESLDSVLFLSRLYFPKLEPCFNGRTIEE